MERHIWKTAVFLITLLFVAMGCGTSDSESEMVPEISGPAFVLFYTDN